MKTIMKDSELKRILTNCCSVVSFYTNKGFTACLYLYSGAGHKRFEPNLATMTYVEAIRSPIHGGQQKHLDKREKTHCG